MGKQMSDQIFSSLSCSLDDLREFRSMDGDVVPMPLYIRKQDLDTVSKAFPYIIEKDPFEVCGAYNDVLRMLTWL